MKKPTKLKVIVLVFVVLTSIICNGCRREKPLSPVDNPPNVSVPTKYYSLVFGNEYKTSFSYPLTESVANRYMKHLNDCPISLKMLTFEEYKDQYVSKVVKKYDEYDEIKDFAGENVVGHFVGGWRIKGWPSLFIFVATTGNPHSVMSVYFHELGHYECNVNKCLHCVLGNKTIPELHAILNELE
jgi:hypothetical protein